MMKKFTCLLLVYMVFLTMSCSNEDAVADNTEIETEVTAKDMYGYEFIFKAMADYETFFFPEPVSSAYGDKILARYNEAAEKFKCIVNVAVEAGTLRNELISAAASAEKYADLTDTFARTIYENIDYFMPLNDFTGFDIKDTKWGPQSYL